MKFCLLILIIILFFGFLIIKFLIIRKVWNYISLIKGSSLLFGVKYLIVWFFFLKNVFEGFDFFFCNKNLWYFVRDFLCGVVRIDLCCKRWLYIFDIFIGMGFVMLKDDINCWLSYFCGKRNVLILFFVFLKCFLIDGGVLFIRYLCW